MKISKLFLFSFVFFVSVTQCETENNTQICIDASQEQNSAKINKQELTREIKGLILDELYHEMYIFINAESIHHWSQGNKELGEDIIALHDSFSDRESAQTNLDEFCNKWELENINIREVLRLGWKAIEERSQ